MPLRVKQIIGVCRKQGETIYNDYMLKGAGVDGFYTDIPYSWDNDYDLESTVSFSTISKALLYIDKIIKTIEK